MNEFKANEKSETIEYSVTCSCGSKMNVGYLQVVGQELIRKCNINTTQIYRGTISHWICPTCNKNINVFTGVKKDE